MDSNSDWRVVCPRTQDKHLHLLNSEMFSDVVFVVGDMKVRIHAHKFILIVASPVFQIQFGERWDQENYIQIQDVSPKAFRMFLEYLYGDKFSVTENEAADVFYLAHKYMTKGLSDKCSDLLASVINVLNVIQIYDTATKFNEGNLQEKAMKFILMNGTAVLDDIRFLRIKKDTLKMFLGNDKFVTQEITIFRAVMRWAENRCKVEGLASTVGNKRIVLKEVIPLIRFTLMSAEELTNEVTIGEYEGILSDTETTAIYKYWNVGSSMRSHLPILPFNVKRRSCRHFCNVVMNEAGFEQEQDSSTRPVQNGTPRWDKIECVCGHILCSDCNDDWHPPIMCSLLCTWKKKYTSLLKEYPHWIVNSKSECPFCQASNNKMQGNFIRCRNSKCCRRYYLLWKHPYNDSERDSTNFARYFPTSDKEVSKRFTRDKFYFYRFMEHEDSLNREKEFKTKVQMRDNCRLVHADAFIRAVEMLARTRALVMYSYVFAFYARETEDLEEFVDSQGSLEDQTEILSSLLERYFRRTSANMKVDADDWSNAVVLRVDAIEDAQLKLVDLVNKGYRHSTWKFRGE